MTLARSLADVSRRLSDELASMAIIDPVTHVYDPTRYARSSHETYVALAQRHVHGLMLGMNPGPWGMVQTGVPFGEVAHVREYLGIEAPVDRPSNEHPKRPVQGFDCPRSEVSGRRLWGWVKARFGTPDAFFRNYFVWNWCPLAFLESSGRNRTPDKLPLPMRRIVEPTCDAALADVVELIKPRSLIAVGTYAEKRAQAALGDALPIHRILHPSPASPAANRGWEPQVDQQMAQAGLPMPSASAT